MNKDGPVIPRLLELQKGIPHLLELPEGIPRLLKLQEGVPPEDTTGLTMHEINT